MNQTILNFAGRKQAGKSTSYTCIRLWRPDAIEFSFAEPLKRMCVDILGVEEWQVYGTDEQKRTLVPHLLWENFPLPAYTYRNGTVFIGHPNMMPKVNAASVTLIPTSEPQDDKRLSLFDISSARFETSISSRPYEPQFIHYGELLKPRTGPMTAREVLQYWGTEIFRKQYHNVWAEACIRKIRKSGCSLAVITDCRFANEVEVVQKAGGKVIKLTRNPFPEDSHPSEVALDPERYDQERFDYILNNATMNINEQCEELYGLCRRWDIVQQKEVSRMHV